MPALSALATAILAPTSAAATIIATSATIAAIVEPLAAAIAAMGGATVVFLGASQINGQGATVEVLAMELSDGRLGIFGAEHLHETKTARALSFAVHD